MTLSSLPNWSLAAKKAEETFYRTSDAIRGSGKNRGARHCGRAVTYRSAWPCAPCLTRICCLLRDILLGNPLDVGLAVGVTGVTASPVQEISGVGHNTVQKLFKRSSYWLRLKCVVVGVENLPSVFAGRISRCSAY